MRFLILLTLFSYTLISQNSFITVDERNKDMGAQENIYKVRADYIIQNNQAKNLYFLRADAEKGMTVRASKKTVSPGDTVLVVVEFIPESTGKFSKNIQLITSADGQPFRISLSGTIRSIKTDDKTACFYFKNPNHSGVKETPPLVAYQDPPKRDVSNRMPDNAVSTPLPKPIEPTQPEQVVIKPESVKNEKTLNPDLYKLNNIVFVIDVSSSMKDSAKLLALQHSMQYLVEALRPEDLVTLISYADSVRVLKEAISGGNKQELMEAINKLRARGLTKGNKAILFSMDKALRHYLPQGNNQIILATDGKFRFYSGDQQKYLDKQGDKKILLTTVAFGNDKEAISNLKEIARVGNGNFIHIRSKNKAKEQLLDEIREQSLIHK